MPLYDYECQKCGIGTEVFASISTKRRRPRCPECRKLMDRVFSAPVVQGDYVEPQYSEAMGVDSSQVAEHRRVHPDIPITDDGRVEIKSRSERKRICKKLGYHDRNSFTGV